MLKNDTLKNGTSRIGLYGSAPPPPDKHGGFQNIVLPNPVSTVENSADNIPVHTTHSKSAYTTCMVSNPITAEHSPTARPAELHRVKPVQFLKDFRVSAKR